MAKKYETVIGLEVHVELKTNTKIFCGCSTKFGGNPNSNTCPICLGMPGTLPVLNEKVVKFGVMLGCALNAKVSNFCKFDRKNYYYPDLTKNFQISQFDLPICKDGHLDIEINGETIRIGITRAHMEEDAGKLVHSGKTIASSSFSRVDYNRAGVPLLEIVSEPDIKNSEEARVFIEKLRQIISYMEISDCKMEEGSVRCDVNVSVRPIGQKKLGTKTEIKNLNSLKVLEKSIKYEAQRQIEVIEKGEFIVQETRTWDDEKGITLSMRSKEEAKDYRYFPEPDLLPIIFSDEWIEEIRESLPELPDDRRKRIIKYDGLSKYDADLIISERIISDFYDGIRKNGHDGKTIVNFLMGDYMKSLKEEGETISSSKVTIESFSKLLDLIKDNTISGKIAKEIIPEMIKFGKAPEVIVKEKGLVQITDLSEIELFVNKVLNNNLQAIEDYKSGKESAIGFLVGQVMKVSKGKASPDIVNGLLKDKLK